MCEDCGGICAVFDRMIAEFFASLPGDQTHRRYFHPMEVKGATGTKDSTTLADFVEEAACIGMTPQTLAEELKRRTKFHDAVEDWIKERRVPNGMVRKIILTNAEEIIREHGAQPQLTFLAA